jgi:NhaP-type Na+/H+ or K+/H+ antiporter
MWSLLAQFLLVGMVLGALLLWLLRWLLRQLGSLRWRARRLARARGLVCVQPMPVVYDPHQEDGP